MWQFLVFPSQVLSPIHRSGKPLESSDFECTLDHIKPTKYDEMAIQSYRAFCKLRDQGIIPSRSPLPGLDSYPNKHPWTHIEYANCERVEPLYLERFTQDLRRLQRAIPAQDLAIQIDAAIELVYLEYTQGRIHDPIFKPYFSSITEGILERISKFSSAIDQDVRLGFRLCYGDRQHQNFFRPEDAGLLT